jgi:ABC-type branched-subunit amino acid transport system permease subunit
VSAAWQFYFITLLVYTGVDVIAVWALNLQYGLGGILNFAFVIFQSIGAYVASVLTLGPASASGGYEHYVLGARLPWPLPLLAAFLAGGALAFLVGLFALRPRRTDYQGMVLLAVALIAAVVVSTEVNLFNGTSGVAGVPRPLESELHLGLVDYGWFYCALTALVVGVVYLLVHRLTSSPWGRMVRAMRENPTAVRSLGGDVERLRMQAFVIGGAIAAVSGALLVQFLGAWAPASWSTTETFIFFVCVVVGGLGNNFGAALGAVVVLTILDNGLQYLPVLQYSTDVGALQAVAFGLVVIAFLWFRPRGLVPERRRRFGGRRGESTPQPAPSAAEGAP